MQRLWRYCATVAGFLGLLVLVVLLVWGPVWGPGWVQSPLPVHSQDCTVRILSVSAARAERGIAANTAGSGATGASAARDASVRPLQGWEPVTLPDTWSQRWPDHEGTVWYRIHWERGCPAQATGAQPLALSVRGMSMAGEVFINDDLLWRDASLVEPLSRSWNMPYFFLLPESALTKGVNTVWVRVVGLKGLSPGVGTLQLGPMHQVMHDHDNAMWRQRLVYLISAGLTGTVGCLFLVVWCLRRTERAYGWYAAMSLCWLAYMSSMLVTSPWPLPDTLAMARANIAAFVLYALCFCLFTFRFGRQELPRTEKAIWALTAVSIALLVLTPDAYASSVFILVWLAYVAVVFAACVQFQWHAWRTRDPQHLLLALCWLFLLLVGIHDLAVVFNGWSAHESWVSVTSPVTTVFMSLLLGGRLVADTRRIERFNRELGDAVTQARTELAQVLTREHRQALQHAKLQERLEISHDLHDGLGGNLMRSMALMELAPQLVSNERVMSLLKVLRDDLRQVIDHGSSAGIAVPETPVQWAAPLRHRFTRILDEMKVSSEWHIAPQWLDRPSALQCLGLTRLVEEALSNAIKHSRAQHVRVECTQPQRGALLVCIKDDGVGFDVDAVHRAGLSVGMRSMAARAKRIGATLTVTSGPAGTVLAVMLALPSI